MDQADIQLFSAAKRMWWNSGELALEPLECYKQVSQPARWIPPRCVLSGS